MISETNTISNSAIKTNGANIAELFRVIVRSFRNSGFLKRTGSIRFFIAKSGFPVNRPGPAPIFALYPKNVAKNIAELVKNKNGRFEKQIKNGKSIGVDERIKRPRGRLPRFADFFGEFNNFIG